MLSIGCTGFAHCIAFLQWISPIRKKVKGPKVKWWYSEASLRNRRILSNAIARKVESGCIDTTNEVSQLFQTERISTLALLCFVFIGTAHKLLLENVVGKVSQREFILCFLFIDVAYNQGWDVASFWLVSVFEKNLPPVLVSTSASLETTTWNLKEITW